jgi:4-hydroxybenzoyl-CoA thioesterase
MPFTVTRTVRFQHCDPAGIVFYPRYFEMINATVEDWFEAMGMPFSAMHGAEGAGVPTVSISAEFPAPSRLGDRLEFGVTVEKLGRASAGLKIEARCQGELRLVARPVLVWIDGAAMKARPWPDDLRRRMAEMMED